MNRWTLGSGLCALLLVSSTAHAGIPECADLRLEDVSSCELRGSVDCQAGCDELGVYKKACATRLQKVCKEECVLDPDPTCEDECTGPCTEQCDAGLNITCIHNCFGECSGTCEIDCRNADDPSQCVATCEANCDAECDIRCKPLVDGDCYKHCIECCGGSCTAQANMTCQQTCQTEQFEECEHEFRVSCDASCSGDGSLFCDGEYALSGSDIPVCAQALLEEGVELVNLETGIDVGGVIGSAGTGPIDTGSGSDGGKIGTKAGCSLTPANHGSGHLGVLVSLLAATLYRRRRQAVVSRR